MSHLRLVKPLVPDRNRPAALRNHAGLPGRALSPASHRVSGSSPTATSAAGLSDAALVVAARARETWAREALFQRHASLAFGLAHRFGLRDLKVDHLVQKSFLYAFQRLSALENPHAFAAWLGTIVVRAASEHFRRQRLLMRLGLRRCGPIELDGIVSPGAPPHVVAELRALYAVIERFPAEERIALILRHVEGLAIPQIAEHMNSSESTLKRRLRAAEARLARCALDNER